MFLSEEHRSLLEVISREVDQRVQQVQANGGSQEGVQEVIQTRSGSPDRRRKDPAEKTSFMVRTMSDRHHEISRLILLGLNNKQIAERLNCSAQTVSIVRNSPAVREKLSLLQSARDMETVNIQEEIRRIAEAGVRLIRQVVENDEAPLDMRVREANKALDRAGYPQMKQTNVLQGHLTLTPQDITDLKNRALAEGEKLGLVKEKDSAGQEYYTIPSAETEGPQKEEKDVGE